MTVASVSSIASPALSATASGTPTSEPAASAATPVPASSDKVTLSAAAQQALSASSEDAAVEQAVGAINNTSGQTSIADQLQAYALVANFVDKGQPVGAADQQADTDATSALLNSSFAQHAQNLENTISGQIDWSGGGATANSIDGSLAAFNALSTTDQQIYVGVSGLQSQLVSHVTPIATVADYQANQAAQADVDRALQAAVSSPTYASAVSQGIELGVNGEIDRLGPVAAAAGDQATTALVQLSRTTSSTVVWTQQVQAYFAQYGPPPAPTPTTGTNGSSKPSHGYQTPDGTTLTPALAAVNDTSGKTAFNDQISSYVTLINYLISGTDWGPGRTAVADSFEKSTFFKQVDTATQQFNDENLAIDHAADARNSDLKPSESELSQLDKLPLQQQQLIYAGTASSFSSLDAWKVELTQDQALITAAYNRDNGDGATNALAKAGISIADTTASGPNTSAARALTILTSPKSTDSDADVALTLLQNATEAKLNTKGKGDNTNDDAVTSSTKSKSNVSISTINHSLYTAGLAVSVVA